MLTCSGQVYIRVPDLHLLELKYMKSGFSVFSCYIFFFLEEMRVTMGLKFLSDSTFELAAPLP